MESTSGAKIAPKSLDGDNDVDTLCLNDIHELMKDGASRNKLSPRDIRALKGAVVTHGPIETDVSNLETETIATVIPLSPESLDSTCHARTRILCTLSQRLFRRIFWTLGQKNKM